MLAVFLTVGERLLKLVSVYLSWRFSIIGAVEWLSENSYFEDDGLVTTYIVWKKMHEFYINIFFINALNRIAAQSPGAVEYSDCISAEG